MSEFQGHGQVIESGQKGEGLGISFIFNLGVQRRFRQIATYPTSKSAVPVHVIPPPLPLIGKRSNSEINNNHLIKNHMKKQIIKVLPFCLALLPFLLQAQIPFQELSAYNLSTTPRTGQFNDIECLDYLGPANANVVAIGINSDPVTQGVWGVFDADGNNVYYKEFDNGANPLYGEAIAELPNGHVVLAFFDPVDFATDLVVMNINGITVEWELRLPDFHALDVHADNAPYPGGMGIWITGESIGGNIVVQAFNGTGVQQFAQEHSPLGHDSSVGNAIHFDQNTNEIWVVGTAEITGNPGSNMFCFRMPWFGFWSTGMLYGDPAGIERYSAKDLIPNPAFNSNYAISYEYAPTGLPFDQIGIMNVDNFLAPSWSHNFAGVDFFSGNNYRSTGIEAVGNSFIACGTFNSKLTPIQSSAYALTVNLQGTSPKMNEYELTSYYPSEGCAIQGISTNPGNGLPYMVGHFQTLSGGNNWPSGNDPRSFWLLGTDPFAEGLCSTSGQTQVLASNHTNVPAFFPWGVMPAPVAPSLTHVFVDVTETPQCSYMKMAPSGLEIETRGEVEAYFLPGPQEILIEIASEEAAAGQAEVLDLQGRVLITVPVQNGKQAISTEGLSKGIYLVRTKVNGLPLTVKKLMVE